MPNQSKKSSQSSMRGGTSAQHAKAGSMSHKNKDKKGSYSSGTSSHSSGSRSSSTSNSKS